MLDYRMDTFLEVCKCMNFTAAAQRLGVTQPAVTQHIHHLEEYYGAKLFQQEGKRMQLTGAGRMLLGAATTMKHDDLFLRERMEEAARRESRLIFGATLTVGEFLLPGRLAAYLRERPEVSVRMVVANTRELLAALDAGGVDFAVVEGFFPKSEYDSLPFSREPFVAVCGRDYRPVRPVGRVEDLLGEPLLLREEGSGTREVLERALESRNLTVRDFPRLLELSSLGAIKALAADGCGVAFLYEAAVRRELEEGTLRRLPLEGFPVVRETSFLWRRGSIFAEHYRELFRALRAGGGETGDAGFAAAPERCCKEIFDMLH